MNAPVKTFEPVVLTFASWKEAEEAYYKTNDCVSNDPDLEEGRIMRWLEDNGYQVNE